MNGERVIDACECLEKIQQVIRDNQRVRELDEELLVAKEVSVRLHDELEKSDQARCLVEKLNLSLKHNLDTLRESLHDKLSQVKPVETFPAVGDYPPLSLRLEYP